MDNLTARVVNATPTQLVTISYEWILGELKQSKEYLGEKNEKAFTRSMEKAQSVLRDLMDSLDMSYEISLDLMSLYLYINKSMIQAVMQKSAASIEQAEKLLNTLLVGWEEVASSDTKGAPVMHNAQQVYAGLTYGKGTLNESVMGDKNRGFKA